MAAEQASKTHQKCLKAQIDTSQMLKRSIVVLVCDFSVTRAVAPLFDPITELRKGQTIDALTNLWERLSDQDNVGMRGIR